MTDPLSLRIIDRVIVVLKSIVEGDDYFYTVGERAVKGIRPAGEATGFPFDMVDIGADHRKPEYQPDSIVYRFPTVIIAAYVDKEDGDLVTKLTRHLADVERAIEADLKSTETGSLGQLVGIGGWGHLGAVITDEGELGLDGCAGFRQDLELCIGGQWGDL